MILIWLLVGQFVDTCHAVPRILIASYFEGHLGFSFNFAILHVVSVVELRSAFGLELAELRSLERRLRRNYGELEGIVTTF